MVESLALSQSPLADSTKASQQQHTNGVPIQARNGQNGSESSSSPGVLTPSSSRRVSSRHSSIGQPGLPHEDAPVPSIERGMENLGIDRVPVTVSAPPVLSNAGPSGNVRFENLQAGQDAPVAPDRAGSLSPSDEHDNSLRPRSRRRSSSRRPIQRHEVDQEERPDSRFYTQDFQNALTQSKDLARHLSDALSSCVLHTDETSAIHSLYNQAKDASRYCGPQNWKIGLVGDSGAGKSSLINSLLDSKDLARASNSGAACTCTVTEYHYHDSPEYIIEVVYFPKVRLVEQFTELLQAYRRFHLHRAEDAAENNDLEEASSVAWHTFSAAFRNQALLTEAYLVEQDEPTILENISAWIDQSAPVGYSQAGGSANMRRESIAGMEACSDRLMQLTSERPDANVAAGWPYIERVNVFLRATILSKGLILVDLPGLRDTNSARRTITERYIINCNEVFAIANIGRATTDMGVQAVVDLATRTRRQHVGIVCTRSDDINAREAARDWTGPALDRLQRLRRDVERCEERLRSIADNLLYESDRDEEVELGRQERAVKNELKDNEYKLQQHMVTTRNNKVITELRRQYQPTVQHVFCISNEFYWRTRDEDQEVALPWLRLSQIISLRRHCLGLVAEHQRQDASTFMTELIPNLVSSIDLWVRSGSERIAAETRAQVREASQGIERIIQHELISFISPSNRVWPALTTQFRDWSRNQFTIQRDGAWRVVAGNATQDWNGCCYVRISSSDKVVASYAAFCRNYGNWSTAAIGSRCWNAEIIQGMTTELTEPWAHFCTVINDLVQQCIRIVEQSFEQALGPLHALNVIDRENFDSVQTLITTLLQRKDLLLTETRGTIAEYLQAMALLGNADFLSGVRTSFIGQHMEMAYRRAAQDSGTGVTARRRTLINHQVMDPHLWNSIQQKLETRFRDLTRDTKDQIHAANQRHLQAIRTALDTLRNENVVLEAERYPDFRERMRGQVADAQFPLQNIAAAVRAAG